MDGRHWYEYPSTTEPWDESEDGDGLTREPLSPEPRPPFPLRKNLALGGLVALLVVTLVGTAALVRGLRGQPVQATSVMPTIAPRAPVTMALTPTSAPFNPQDNGWTEYTAGVAGGRVTSGDVKFSASSPQRGYICGTDNSGRIIFGMTTDGGQTWVVGQSPAANNSCSIQVSPTNALDVALTSVPGGCGGNDCFSSDAHFSTDGGRTWKAAPIPPNTVRVGGALWSGAYRYVWARAIEGGQQQSGFLEVSVNGGPFTSLGVSSLLPGAQHVSIGSAVASGAKLYLNLTYSGCSSQNCLTIVASGDGGKTWARFSTNSSILLMDVVGNILYGQVTGVQPPTPMLSSDNGATWTTQTLPPLPNGGDARLCVPAPDGTCITTTFSGVAYLRAGAWTIVPFPDPYGDLHVAVALDIHGHPQRVWAIDNGQDYLAGIYWHALP